MKGLPQKRILRQPGFIYLIICRKLEDSSPDTYDKVRINLFGGITIRSKDLEFDESDMKSEALQFLIGFLACNSNKYFPAEVLNARYEGEKDVSVAEGLMRVIDDSSDVTRKIELLRNYHTLFCGKFMGATFTKNSFIRENRLHYKLKYIEKMKLLMKLLYDQGDYAGVAEYCAAILKMYPKSVDINFWRIMALLQQGNYDLVVSIEKNLMELMEAQTYSILQHKILMELKLSEEELANRIEGNPVYLRLFDEMRKFKTH